MAIAELSKIRYKKVECYHMVSEDATFGIDGRAAILTRYHLQPNIYTYPSNFPSKYKIAGKTIDLPTSEIREYRFVLGGGQIIQFLPWQGIRDKLSQKLLKLKDEKKPNIKKIKNSEEDLVKISRIFDQIETKLHEELLSYRDNTLKSKNLNFIVKKFKSGKELPLEKLLSCKNPTWLTEKEIIHNFSLKKRLAVAGLITILGLGTSISIMQNLDNLYKYGIKLPAETIAKISGYNLEDLDK